MLAASSSSSGTYDRSEGIITLAHPLDLTAGCTNQTITGLSDKSPQSCSTMGAEALPPPHGSVAPPDQFSPPAVYEATVNGSSCASPKSDVIQCTAKRKRQAHRPDQSERIAVGFKRRRYRRKQLDNNLSENHATRRAFDSEGDNDEAQTTKRRRRSRKKQFDIDAGDKVFTDNFDEVCKCACKYCGKVQTMDEFRVHLRCAHSETIHDYRKKFGEMDFVSLTYHRSVIVFGVIDRPFGHT
jgi:hypothetical protein